MKILGASYCPPTLVDNSEITFLLIVSASQRTIDDFLDNRCWDLSVIVHQRWLGLAWLPGRVRATEKSLAQEFDKANTAEAVATWCHQVLRSGTQPGHGKTGHHQLLGRAREPLWQETPAGNHCQFGCCFARRHPARMARCSTSCLRIVPY